MNIVFNIQYHTNLGEYLAVEIKGEEVTIPLTTENGTTWRGVWDFNPEERVTKIEYSYTLYREEQTIRREILSTPHTIEVDKRLCGGCIVNDIWRDLPRDNYRYSAAFNHPTISEPAPLDAAARYVTFRALAPALAREGHTLAVVGGGSTLNGWGEPLPMREVEANLYTLSLSIRDEEFEYKFVVIESASGTIVEWECGENHKADLRGVGEWVNYHIAECEPMFYVEPIRIAGSAIPIFSLRSEGGSGVGDFGDLKRYIEWAAATGQQAVQILPINDTTMSHTWQDSYPYNSISIYAFHPMYIDLRALSPLKDEAAMKSFEQQREEVNALTEIDYVTVNNLKRGYLRTIFNEEGEALLHSDEFKTFFQNNKDWLLPYAAFSYLRDEAGSADFSKWGEYSTFQREAIESLCVEGGAAYHNIAFYYYIQYLLHIQLLDAANLARRLGVILKGDIPIGISRESVEAWVEPYYFNMNGQAGAPPDAFSVNGQNWGFPTYNWDVMQRDGYLWWRRRFAKMSEYFTAYRIDHILGFFRIWEIPQHSVHGLLGHFAPSLPMSREEIEGWGLHFDKEAMCEPFINEAMVEELFGDDADMVRKTYLQPTHNDQYAMRSDFATQRLIEAHFRGVEDKRELQIKEALYSLVSNILFVRDHKDRQMYHPRISVQSDYIYKQLSREQQEVFNRLYNHYYYERHNHFWYEEAMKKLPVLICSTSMLVCGEDLGMVPDCVAPVMDTLQITSLEIERMPKKLGEEFGAPERYPHRSVCTIGTHDMSTLRGWWREDDAVRDSYYLNELKREDAAPTDIPGWLCKEVLRRHLDSPSMLVILTLQDWLSIDEKLRNSDIEGERINIPANPRHYWRWRMHLTLEELASQSELNAKIAASIFASGRAKL